MKRWIKPIRLSGAYAVLEPIAADHREGLAAAVRDGELWRLWYTSIPHPDKMAEYIDAALQMVSDTGALVFVVRDKFTDRVIGCSRYFNVDEANQRLEIGHTWYAKSVQRTPINTDCKRLLLSHAFEDLDAIAVEFRTHWHNHASRAAIARLGAKQDGILRHHQRGEDGIFRDTVVFSIIAPEWPTVRKSLDFKLNR